MPSVLPVHSSHGNQPLIVIVRPSTKPTHAPLTTEPIAHPSTEPTIGFFFHSNDYSPPPVVPPVNQAIRNQPLLIIVLPKPTHAPSTTSILDPSTEQAAVPTEEPSSEPTNEYPVIFQVHGGKQPFVVIGWPPSTVKPSSSIPSTVIIGSIYWHSIIIISPL